MILSPLGGIPRSSSPVDSLSDTPLDHSSLDDLVASGEDLSEAESEPIQSFLDTSGNTSDIDVSDSSEHGM